MRCGSSWKPSNSTRTRPTSVWSAACMSICQW